MYEQIFYDVAQALQERGIGCSVEFPLELAIGSINIGTANGLWQWDDGDISGGTILTANGKMIIPASCNDAQYIADAIHYMLWNGLFR